MRGFRCTLVFALAAVTSVLAFGCSWDYSIWIPRNRSADPLYRFTKHGKAGYINREGKVVIPPKFEPLGNSGGEFRDGLALTAVANGKYMDESGRIAIDKGLYRGWDFTEGWQQR